MTRGSARRGTGMQIARLRVSSAVRLIGAILLAAASAAAEPAAVLPLAQVRAGQTGYGVSDFGHGLEKFQVTILGVLRNAGPRRNIILGRLSGAGLEKTGVIAGMSGSPVYIGGRLVGAVAATWPFAREPVAGITPIEEMLAIPPPGPSRPKREALVSGRVLLEALARGSAADLWKRELARAFPASDAPVTAPSLPLAVSVGGIPTTDATLQRIFPTARFVTVPSGDGSEAPGSGAAALAPGRAVSAVLVSGDMSIAATGTVTWNDGKRVLAFGHPFLSMGPVDLPMAPASVFGVFPSLYFSFKLAESGPAAGRLVQDRASGVEGVVGGEPKTVPVHLRIEDGGAAPSEFRFRVASNPLLTPALAAISVNAAVASEEKGAGERTITWRSSIHSGKRTLKFDSVFTGPAANARAVASLALLCGYVLNNPFEKVAIDGIDVSIRHSDRVEGTRIVGLALDRTKARPGETVTARVELADDRGARRSVPFSFRVPPYAPPGPLSVFVGDGESATALDFAIFPADPRSLDQMFRELSRIRPDNSVNLIVTRPAPGAVVDGRELPALPPTMQSLVVGEGGVGSASLSSELVASQSSPQSAPVEGSLRASVEILPERD